jgi:hypothetical protein
MVQDERGKPPTPAERVATARRVFKARYGREPEQAYAHPSQQTEGTQEPEQGKVAANVVWVGPL